MSLRPSLAVPSGRLLNQWPALSLGNIGGFHGGAPPDKCRNLVGNGNACEGSNVITQRNYPCDTLVEGYFGNTTSLDNVGETAFQALTNV